MKHEDEFPMTIEKAEQELSEAVNYIKNKHNDIKKERDDLIAFLRRCQRMSPSGVCDAIDKYIIDYDVPF